MLALKKLLRIIRRHPQTSAFDLSLATVAMATGITLAMIYDLEQLWSEMPPRERTICKEEVFALILLFALCATIFVWRRLLEERQDAARWRKAERELREQRSLAMADPLTGLANRREFLRVLESVLAENVGVSVFLLDLNGFKAINDTFGHAAGDEVLVNVAARFRCAARSEDLVARLGGDEFAVVARSVTTFRQARDVGHRFVKALADGIEVNGTIHHVGAAIGIATSPRDGTTPGALLQSADAAMYAAKRSKPAIPRRPIAIKRSAGKNAHPI